MAKPPFKAKPDDKIFCPIAGHEIPVEPYCHGWCFRDELCHEAETCEPYLEYAKHRIKDILDLSAKRHKIWLPPETMKIIDALARADGLTPDEFVAKTILENTKEVKAHA